MPGSVVPKPIRKTLYIYVTHQGLPQENRNKEQATGVQRDFFNNKRVDKANPEQHGTNCFWNFHDERLSNMHN